MAKYVLILMLVFSLSGCITLQTLAREASSITSEEMNPPANALSTLMDTVVPDPYKVPAAMAGGYVWALLRRLYKKKKGSVA